MKSVWILEKFETVEHARAIIDEMMDMVRNADKYNINADGVRLLKD